MSFHCGLTWHWDCTPADVPAVDADSSASPKVGHSTSSDAVSGPTLGVRAALSVRRVVPRRRRLGWVESVTAA